MTTPINDGGPAYPTVDANRSLDCGTYGMTLRDYFAAKAMNALIAQSHDEICEWLDEVPEGTNGQTNNVLAKVSYELADAMLKARSI